MPIMTNFCGIIPAIAVPFRADYGVDEPELRRFAVWLAQRKGVVGLMTNLVMVGDSQKIEAALHRMRQHVHGPRVAVGMQRVAVEVTAQPAGLGRLA